MCVCACVCVCADDEDGNGNMEQDEILLLMENGKAAADISQARVHEMLSKLGGNEAGVTLQVRSRVCVPTLKGSRLRCTHSVRRTRVCACSNSKRGPLMTRC